MLKKKAARIIKPKVSLVCHIYAEFCFKLMNSQNAPLPATIANGGSQLACSSSPDEWLYTPGLNEPDYISTLTTVGLGSVFHNWSIKPVRQCSCSWFIIWSGFRFCDFLNFFSAFGSDVLLIRRLNFCLALTSFKPSVFGSVICNVLLLLY